MQTGETKELMFSDFNEKFGMNLKDDTIQDIFSRLGVESVEDLDLIEDSDLASILTPIQLRRFQRKKSIVTTMKEPTLDDSFDNLTSDSSNLTPCNFQKPTSQATPVEASFLNTGSVDWAEKVKIPFHKLPQAVLTSLEKEKPTPDTRRQLIRIIVDELRSENNCSRITAQQFRVLAKRIVDKYVILKDTFAGKVVGTGSDSIFNQLVARNDNLNRGKSPFKRSISSASSSSTSDNEQIIKKVKKKDAYGCVNFQPSVGDIDLLSSIKNEMIEDSKQPLLNWEKLDEKIKQTYPLQRKDINQGMNVEELLKNWPLLFFYEGAVLHFELLTGIRLPKVFDAMLSKRERLLRFLKYKGYTDGANSDDNTYVLVSSIIKYFKEKLEYFVFHVDAILNLKEVEKLNERATPVIAVLGSSVVDATEFYIIVDRKVVATLNCFQKAFLFLFAVFYILNIEYTQEISTSLEFFQRCIIGLNTDGSKSNQTARKKSVNAKVLKLINDISSFEWAENV